MQSKLNKFLEEITHKRVLRAKDQNVSLNDTINYKM